VADEARLMRAEVERCRGILQQMSARGAEPIGESPLPVNLGEMLESVTAGLPAGKRDLVKTQVAADARPVMLPPDATRQALAALVRNALDAGAGRPVLVAAECTSAVVRLTVQDSGCGMSRETLNRLAEPFFTTKEPGRGMGLGTFLVRAFAQRMKGSLAFESEMGAGTRAILELPLRNDERQRDACGVDRR
jgi:two-component system sensor histidine kinase RegB